MIRSKAISLSLSAALLVSAAGIAGCNTKQPANTNIHTKNVHDGINGMNGRLNVNSVRDGGDWLTTKNTNGTKHNITDLHVAQHIAKKVTAMGDVSSAHVLVAGNSAYVAVKLADNVSGPNMKSESYPSHVGNGYKNGTMHSKSMNTGPSSSFNNSGTSPSSSFNNSSTGTMNTDGSRGLYGTMGTGSYGIMRGLSTGTTGANYHDSGFTGVDGMKERITRSNGYNATTYGTGGTTGTTHDGNMVSYSNENLPIHIKSKISTKVKEADPSIKNVYVSANPDFVQRVSNFSTETMSGHPVKGMISEFSTMVERIFPMNVGNVNHNQMITPRGTAPAPTPTHMMR